ncbi:hypothetical protein H1C71_005601, partial [Ictidomys tridecemlineatus]
MITEYSTGRFSTRKIMILHAKKAGQFLTWFIGLPGPKDPSSSRPSTTPMVFWLILCICLLFSWSQDSCQSSSHHILIYLYSEAENEDNILLCSLYLFIYFCVCKSFIESSISVFFSHIGSHGIYFYIQQLLWDVGCVTKEKRPVAGQALGKTFYS